MVGKDISTQNAGNFKPSVFAIDVTNPREPILMWEKSFDDLGFSTNFPAVIKAGEVSGSPEESWKRVYASGPSDFDYDQATGEMTIFRSNLDSPDPNPHIYIIDMKTGEVERNYTVTGDTFKGSYLASPAAFDKELNYNVDSIFMGCTYNENASGAIFKITVTQTFCFLYFCFLNNPFYDI